MNMHGMTVVFINASIPISGIDLMPCSFPLPGKYVDGIGLVSNDHVRLSQISGGSL